MQNHKILSKESKQILCELGYFYTEAKEYDKATAIFKSLIMIDDQTPFKLGLANMFFAMGDYNKAVGVCDDILSVHPDDKLTRLMKAEYLLFLGDKDSSQKFIDNVLNSNPDKDIEELANQLKEGIRQGLSDWTKQK